MDGDGHFTVQFANPPGDLLGLLNRGSFDKSTEPEGDGDFSKEPSELSESTELSSPLLLTKRSLLSLISDEDEKSLEIIIVDRSISSWGYWEDSHDWLRDSNLEGVEEDTQVILDWLKSPDTSDSELSQLFKDFRMLCINRWLPALFRWIPSLPI